MAAPFSKPAVLAVKLTLLAILGLLVAAVAAAHWRMRPAYGVLEPIAQPIPFSHKHHVGDDGIDCRYCHTSVEKSGFAGMPSTSICLSCHSQLFLDSPLLAPLHESARTGRPVQWVRVHDLPDFVYFEHDIHVNKGVACVECHGRVDQMPLTWRTASLEMQWCLGCHRNAPQHIRPLSKVLSMAPQRPLTPEEVRQLDRLYRLRSANALTNCSTCHR
ncbi:Menaquinone reductase, multiheme cytochrome c subunit [Massilia sp. Bi118]|uniref:cytochrome c3 family protein n=1 Tax=Massilia sp. Bi118 TaxID=2822346 RepID=UPI001E0BB858|nr:cytochrome c3 family protein [Massilia sp. Bi118]CAH0259964.1 Menaquinone reductase, multiheme cytochrome c subunit [Massilia sp. Bi118]